MPKQHQCVVVNVCSDPTEDLLVVFLAQLMPSNTYDFRGQLRNLVYSAIVD